MGAASVEPIPIEQGVQTSLDRLIGEGEHRKVILLDENRCVKRVKEVRNKDFFGYKIGIDIRLYYRIKYGTENLNKIEMKNYEQLIEKLPGEMREYFSTIEGLDEEGGLISRVVRDYDGSISRTLEEGGSDDILFWSRITEIESAILDDNIPYFGAFGGNVLVRRKSDDISVPVFVDYKKFGAGAYPMQPWLLIDSFANSKVRKHFNRLRENYNTVPF